LDPAVVDAFLIVALLFKSASGEAIADAQLTGRSPVLTAALGDRSAARVRDAYL
jgi:hypothetical protein